MQKYINGSISKTRFVLTIFACSVILLPGGSLCYGYSSLSPYLLSYDYHQNNGNAKFGYSSWMYCGFTFGLDVGIATSGFLESIVPFHYLALPSIVLFDVSLFIASFTIGTTALFCATYIVMGLTVGLLYTISYRVGLSWVKEEYYGLFSGLISFAFGISALITSPLQTLYVNPHNVKPANVSQHYNIYVFTQDDVLEKIPKLYLVYGAISVSLQIPLSLLLKINPTEVTSHKSLAASVCSLKQIMSRREFWILVAIYGLTAIPIAYTATYSNVYGELFIHNNFYLSFVIASSGIFNAVGRPFWGYLKDKLRMRSAIILLCLTTAFFILTWFLSGFMHSGFVAQGIFTLGVWGVFFSCCGCYAIFPAVAARIFGNENFGAVYGIMNMAQAIGEIIFAGIADAITKWLPLTITISIVCFLSSLMTLLIPKEDHAITEISNLVEKPTRGPNND